jgi:Ca-activated chloride channel family protein
MTSATQSNSGASAYLAMLASAFGDGGRFDPRSLDDEDAKAKVKTLLKGVARSSGSSGWLSDLYLDAAKANAPFDAMWNYEAVLKEDNDQLRANGEELLYAIYPADGVTYADAPLGFVDRGQPKATREFFTALQAYLLSTDAQKVIAESGRRTAPGMAAPAKAEPEWNFDPNRVVTSIGLPEAEAIARALQLYQEALRRPSLTALCLDFSGSMEGEGEKQLKQAVTALFTPDVAARSLIQWTPSDHILVLPFDSEVRQVIEGDGKPESQAQLLTAVENNSAGGGTDIYACALTALQAMKPYLEKGTFLPAIVLMTDGRSDENDAFAQAWAQSGTGIPIFGVTFGDADKTQLDQLASLSRARVFDGGKSLTDAFRTVRGYN